MGSGLAAASSTGTHSLSNARQLSSWWARGSSPASRITSGQATSPAVCVSALPARNSGRMCLLARPGDLSPPTCILPSALLLSVTEAAERAVRKDITQATRSARASDKRPGQTLTGSWRHCDRLLPCTASTPVGPAHEPGGQQCSEFGINFLSLECSVLNRGKILQPVYKDSLKFLK